jgi:hypothetical protein
MHHYVQIPTDMIFWLLSKLVFKIFHPYRIIFLKSQLYILIELEILYRPVYLLIFLCSFIERKTGVQRKYPQLTSTKNVHFFAVFFNYNSKEINYVKASTPLDSAWNSLPSYIFLSCIAFMYCSTWMQRKTKIYTMIENFKFDQNI